MNEYIYTFVICESFIGVIEFIKWHLKASEILYDEIENQQAWTPNDSFVKI